MLALFNRAMLPHLSLLDALPQWQNIAHRLAEPPRKRVRQCEKLEFILS